jgi:glycosyltransferase involved in cell wall biosynthesis
MKLKIAAKIDNADREYYETQVKAKIAHPLIEYIGEVNDYQKNAFLGGAAALLFPIDWPEPFGLVMIEAMACGTPVISYNCGSVPEVMEDRRSGFIVESRDAAIEAVDRLNEISREECRRYFEKRFTDRRMAEDYLRVYRRLSTRPRLLKVATSSHSFA